MAKLYYEDYRLRVLENELGRYDIYDEKFGGRLTRKNASKEWVDNFIQRVQNKRKNLPKQKG